MDWLILLEHSFLTTPTPMRYLFTLVFSLLASASLLAQSSVAYTGGPPYTDDPRPYITTGASLPLLSADDSSILTHSIDPNNVRAYRYGDWNHLTPGPYDIEVPIQVDERHTVLDVGRAMQPAIYVGSSNPIGVSAQHENLFYNRSHPGGLFRTWYSRNRSGTWGTDLDMNLAGPLSPAGVWDDPLSYVDSDDEIVFMRRDFGLRSTNPCERAGEGSNDPSCSSSSRRMVIEVQEIVDNETRYIYIDLGKTFGGSESPLVQNIPRYIEYRYDPEPRFDPTVATPPDTLYPYGYDFGKSQGSSYPLDVQVGGSGSFRDSGGNCPSGNDLGANPELTVILTPSYALRIRDRYIIDSLVVQPKSFDPITVCDDQGNCEFQVQYGENVIDRSRYGLRPDMCSRTEFTASAARGAMTVIKQGPVRAIRGAIGFNSGNTTEVTDYFYRDIWITESKVRIHRVPSFYLGIDYLDDTAMQGGTLEYTNNLLGGSYVLMDGQGTNIPTSIDVSAPAEQEGSMYQIDQGFNSVGLQWDSVKRNGLSQVSINSGYRVVTDMFEISPNDMARNIGVFINKNNRDHREYELSPQDNYECNNVPVGMDASNSYYVMPECTGRDNNALHAGLMITRAEWRNQANNNIRFNSLDNTDPYRWNKDDQILEYDFDSTCSPIEIYRYTTFGDQTTDLSYISNYGLGIEYSTTQCPLYQSNNMANSSILPNLLNVPKISVYPNPTSEFIELNIESISDMNISIHIYDRIGRMIMKRENIAITGNPGDAIRQDLRDISGGLYYLLVISEGRSWTLPISVIK